MHGNQGTGYESRCHVKPDTVYELLGIFDRLSTTPTTTTTTSELASHGPSRNQDYGVFRTFRFTRPYRFLRLVEVEVERNGEPPDLFLGPECECECEYDDGNPPSTELIDTFIQAVSAGEFNISVFDYHEGSSTEVPVRVDKDKREIYVDRDVLYRVYFRAAIWERKMWDRADPVSALFWDYD